MRVIFEELDGDYYFEVILLDEEIERLASDGVCKDFVWDKDFQRDLNIFIRKENESEKKDGREKNGQSSEKVANGQESLSKKGKGKGKSRKGDAGV